MQQVDRSTPPRAVVCIRDYFYTLRETEIVQQREAGGGVRWVERMYHVRNLSQDATEACDKAREFATANGLVFNQTAASLEADMLAIKRATAQEKADRAKREAAEAEAEARAAADHAAAVTQLVNAELAEGILARGRPIYSAEAMLFEIGNGATIRGLAPIYYGDIGRKWIDMNHLLPGDMGYIDWVAKSYGRGEFEGSPAMTLRGKAVVERFGEKPLPEPTPGVTLGVPKQRLESTVVIVSKRRFGSKVLVKMVDAATGAALVHWCSGQSYGDVGDRVAVKLTVKRCGEYDGAAQTVVTRVTAL